jgi:hypothetical protein
MSALLSTPVRRGWLAQLLSCEPHQVVGPPDNPYLKRWFLLPGNRWGNVYLHEFMKSDDPDALHNHPWGFMSICLRRGYVEVTESGRRARTAGSVAIHRASFRHRIEVTESGAASGRPCWTLVVTGPKVQEWGFFCGRGRFVPWTQFDGGCGEDQR